ncbi:MAG: hypothetical protein U0R44_00035 [Candidatus Micrarchaeia archaeon]
MPPTHSSDPPGMSRKYPQRENPRSLEEIRRLLRLAHEKGIEQPELTTCNPQGTEENKLNYHLETVVEPRLMEVAYDIPGYSYITVLLDKARQNPLNKLGGKEGGDKVIEAYWDIAGRAAQLVSAINGSHDVGISLIRVSPFSDEGIIIIGGSELTPRTEIEFREAWLMMSRMADLRSYKYSIEIPYGHGSERFDLDLDAFSKVLKWPEIVTSATYMVSRPVVVDPDSRGGFIQEEIRKLENREIAFYDQIPDVFKVHGELAEVSTRFDQSLMSLGMQNTGEGCYVEIKFGMERENSAAFLPFTKDGWGDEYGIERTVGTRKGFAEIFSGIAGMRFLNTFYGKARANRMLSPVAKAMEDVKNQKKVGVIPVSGGYLQYWVQMPATDETLDYIKEAVRRRINSDRGGDWGYMNAGFEPHISVIEAEGINVSDIRARFILDSMGKEYAPVATLERTDFLLNFLENANARKVKKAIFSSLAMKENGGSPVRISDLKRMDLISRICDEKRGGRRTIRDTEDLVWTLRNDTALPDDIKAKKEDLEEWLFDFAHERYDRIRLLLTRMIKDIMEGKVRI